MDTDSYRQERQMMHLEQPVTDRKLPTNKRCDEQCKRLRNSVENNETIIFIYRIMVFSSDAQKNVDILTRITHQCCTSSHWLVNLEETY